MPHLHAPESACNSLAIGDLFDAVEQRYPESPGYKVAGTSMESAFKIAAHAKTVEAAVLREYVAIHPNVMTADNVANVLNESILTVRPRVSELKRKGWLELTPMTQPNAVSGHKARALRATAKAMEANQ